VFIFGGQFTTDNMVHSLNPFTANHERNYVVGGAYERDLKVGKRGFILGGEIGVADRFGMGESAELWGGLNLRHKGVVIFNLVRITPGITGGSVPSPNQSVPRRSAKAIIMGTRIFWDI